jgi:hypothetical protein
MIKTRHSKTKEERRSLQLRSDGQGPILKAKPSATWDFLRSIKEEEEKEEDQNLDFPSYGAYYAHRCSAI